MRFFDLATLLAGLVFLYIGLRPIFAQPFSFSDENLRAEIDTLRNLKYIDLRITLTNVSSQSLYIPREGYEIDTSYSVLLFELGADMIYACPLLVPEHPYAYLEVKPGKRLTYRRVVIGRKLEFLAMRFRYFTEEALNENGVINPIRRDTAWIHMQAFFDYLSNCSFLFQGQYERN